MSKHKNHQQDLIVIDLVSSDDDDHDGHDRDNDDQEEEPVHKQEGTAMISTSSRDDGDAIRITSQSYPSFSKQSLSYQNHGNENDDGHYDHNDDGVTKFDENVQKVKQGKEDPTLLFQDDDFPPLPSSLRGAHGTMSKQINCRCKGEGGGPQPAQLKLKPNGRPYYACSKSCCDYFSWAFTAELMHWYRFGRHTGHVLVGPNGFRATDLCQGRIGDCWFLSALAVVAERPDLIARLFPKNVQSLQILQREEEEDEDQEEEEEKVQVDSGLIRVRLFLDGYWKTVIVDNFLPCMTMSHDYYYLTQYAATTTVCEASGSCTDNNSTTTSSSTTSSSSSKYNPFALADSCQKTLHETMEFLHGVQQQQKQKQQRVLCNNNNNNNNSTHPLKRTVTSSDLAYSTAKDNQLWVPFLEKAYAKSHGCYSAISGGHIAEAFLDLTGAPTLVYDLHSQEFEPRSFWKKLLHYREQRLPMGCGTTSSAAGIIGMHAYSILDVREVKNVAFSFFQETGVAHGNVSGFTEYDGTVRLLRIRNPHGKGEWKGDFSDQSQIWYKLLQHHQYSHHDNGQNPDNVFWTRTMCNDGTFWIDYDNFLMGFSNVDVVLAFLGNHAKSLPTNFPTNKKSNHRCARAFEVSLMVDASAQQSNDKNDRPVEVYVMGIQKTKRGASKGRVDRKKSYKMCDLGVLVGERGRNIVDDKDEFVTVNGEMFGFRRDGHYRLILDRNKMSSCVVMPISFGHPAATDKELSFVMRFVSDAPLAIRELERVPRMDIALHKFCLEAPPSANKQRIRKILLEDSLYRLVQVDCLGNSGGIIFLYLCINEEMLGRVQQHDHHGNDFGLSFSVDATCRGMSCRTEAGLLEHETISKGKKFEASWRRYHTEFISERKSRLLLVLYQSGQDTEFGGIHCKPIVTPPKKVGNMITTQQQATLTAFLDVHSVNSKLDKDSEEYTRRGVFNAISGNTAFHMAEKFHNDYAKSMMKEHVYILEDDANFELERAMAISLSEATQFQPNTAIENDIEFQRALELSKNDVNGTCILIDGEDSGEFGKKDSHQIESLAVTGTKHDSYDHDLARAIQLSLTQGPQSKEDATIIDLTDESPSTRKRPANRENDECISAGKKLQIYDP